MIQGVVSRNFKSQGGGLTPQDPLRDIYGFMHQAKLLFLLPTAAAGFLVFIIALGIIKYIIFAILFALSAGKLRFWIFPNLTEDVGFFESFWPIYDYTYTGVKAKDKDSDDEESDDEEETNENEDKSEALNNEKNEEADQSESDDSTSKKSSVAGKDFEMVDKHDDTDA